MNGYSKKIENIIETIPNNKLIIASQLYIDKFNDIPELTYYKNMERLTKKGELIHLTKGIYYKPLEIGKETIRKEDIVNYYVDDLKGVVIGYDLYNRIGITNTTDKATQIISTKLNEEKKNINKINVEKTNIELNKDNILIMKVLDILQNYNKIENINDKALIRYLSYWLKFYSDESANYVLKNKKYKKSTIAFLANILEKLEIKHTLNQYLSHLSNYKVPVLAKGGKVMPDNIAKVVNGFTEDVSQLFGKKLSKIILYGSYARGDYKKNSDVDIMILVKIPEAEIKPYEKKIYDIAFDIEIDLGVDISPIIHEEEHFNYWVDSLPFYQNVRNEGVVISG